MSQIDAYQGGQDDHDSEDGQSLGSVATDTDLDTRDDIHLDMTKCRANFYHPSSGTHRTCGKLEVDCRRSGHKTKPKGKPGYYKAREPIRTGSPSDGDTDTFRSVEEVQEELEEKRASDRALMSQAVSSPHISESARKARPVLSVETVITGEEDSPMSFVKVEDSAGNAALKQALFRSLGGSTTAEDADYKPAAQRNVHDFIDTAKSSRVTFAESTIEEPRKPAPAPSNLKPTPPPPVVKKESMDWQKIEDGMTRLWEEEQASRMQAEAKTQRMERQVEALMKSLAEKEKLWEANIAALAQETKRGAESRAESRAREAPATVPTTTVQGAESRVESRTYEAPATVPTTTVQDSEPSLKEFLSKLTTAVEALTVSQATTLPKLESASANDTPRTSREPATNDGVATVYPTGPDTSTGATDVYGVNALMNPTKVLEVLCPSGIPSDAIEALGEILPDTGAMPGTYARIVHDSESEFADKLGGMLQQLHMVGGNSRRQKDYGVASDTQWKSPSRTQLKMNMSAGKFDTMLDLFETMEPEYVTAFTTSVSGVLTQIPWLDPTMSETFVNAGRLREIFVKSMDNYRRLLTYIDKLHRDANWELASIALNYYTTKMAVIRAGSTLRITMVLRTYILLRESARSSFMTSAVQGRMTKYLAIKAMTSSSSDEVDPAAGFPACSVCTVRHERKPCPFAGLSKTVAVRLAKSVQAPASKRWMGRAKVVRAKHDDNEEKEASDG
jgi:hypothetical protein